MRRQLDIAYRGHVHNTGQQSGLAHMFRSEKLACLRKVTEPTLTCSALRMDASSSAKAIM